MTLDNMLSYSQNNIDNIYYQVCDLVVKLYIYTMIILKRFLVGNI